MKLVISDAHEGLKAAAAKVLSATRQRCRMQDAPHADPQHHPLERLNAEIKRRTEVVGIFPSEAAITRLAGALLLEQNDEWQLQRRYMSLEPLPALIDNQPARLSAVVS